MPKPVTLNEIIFGVLFAAGLLRDERARADAAEARAKEARDALEALMAEQEGPPLIRNAASWEAAMNRARAVIEAKA
ncbi:MAG: hypothetical protein EHM32_01680 [Spirochaetales bacterium]|nr:MAG: hypothetical protein EHM32_01680 [Spirochaetales bacterium]